MGFLLDRVQVVASSVKELLRHGLPEFVGDLDREWVMLLDGVGGFQFVPLMARKVIREAGAEMGSTWFRWQVPVPGLVLCDLMRHRRNLTMAARLAHQMVTLRRRHPTSKIHLVGFSGGSGIAVFALEQLAGRVPIETLLLACPGLSPTYNLAPAMLGVNRAFALISSRDRWILGTGTGLFGTMDRKYGPAAGQVGFSRPADFSRADREAYARIHEIHWTPELRGDGHAGGHTGWVHDTFLRRHLLPILAGNPLLPFRSLDFSAETANNSTR